MRQHLNRSVVHADPEEMIAAGDSQNTLFHQMPALETAIRQGQAIELSRSADLYGRKNTGLIQVYPLQLIYYDIAWYLLCEYIPTGHLAAHRVNRFRNHCQNLNLPPRGIDLQRKSLDKAHQLLENGWGLFLGEPDQQQAELAGNLQLQTVKVRFFPPVAGFILEGDRRHPKQRIRSGRKDPTTGKASYVDYSVPLPQRSLREFSWWVNRHLHHAQVLSPPQLVEQYRQAAAEMATRYT